MHMHKMSNHMVHPQMSFPMMFGRMPGMKHRMMHRPPGRKHHHMMQLLHKMGPFMMNKMRSHIHRPHGHHHRIMKHKFGHHGMNPGMRYRKMHKAHGTRHGFEMGHHKMGSHKMLHHMKRRDLSPFMECKGCMKNY
ncbi:unnamed protein product [Nezara viridula]|uniref:Uncharacterized protein n=1 Tax=Nezara viridula TaxID=85310 RepID=A0A9P0E0L6_NEZVI|nr:unnamed protein product [Nezara viridula]